MIDGDEKSLIIDIIGRLSSTTSVNISFEENEAELLRFLNIAVDVKDDDIRNIIVALARKVHRLQKANLVAKTTTHMIIDRLRNMVNIISRESL